MEMLIIGIITLAGFAGRALQSKAAGARRRRMAGSGGEEEEGGNQSALSDF